MPALPSFEKYPASYPDNPILYCRQDFEPQLKTGSTGRLGSPCLLLKVSGRYS